VLTAVELPQFRQFIESARQPASGTLRPHQPRRMLGIRSGRLKHLVNDFS
jgi:hypothetical protein